MAKPKFQHHKPHVAYIVILILLLIPFEAYSFYNLFFITKIFPNIYVNSLPVGGLTREQAGAEIEKNLYSLPINIKLNYNTQTFSIATSSLNAHVNKERTVASAYNIGRIDTIPANLKTRFDLLFQPSSVNLGIDYSPDRLNSALASISAVLNEPAIPPTIELVSVGNSRFATVSAGRQGKAVNEQKLKEDILLQLSKSGNDPIQIPVENVLNPVSNEKLEKTRLLAQNLLNKTLTLSYEDSKWDLNDEALIKFLSIYETFDNEKIASWSGLLANTINREPQNALFNWDGQRVSEFKPAKAGITLDKDKTVENIKNGIQFLGSSNDKAFTINVSVLEAQPKITTDKVNDLGIKELIGVGESWFYHSIASRIHNLTLASSKLHGVLIPPGEEFSMLKTLGDIDAAHGYQPAYIIQNGRTVLGDGGGVCQTSTTLFRAALDAGLDIKTRYPHAYRVSYYEANFDVGVDASVFSPTADFTFINDSPGHILIQVSVDPKNMYLRYELYGTSDGRKVERSKSRIWDQAPPPPDLYQDDPTLAPGAVKQVDWAAWGAKAAFDWKVTRNGEVIHEKTFYSTYRPWQAVYLRGPSQ